MESPGAAVGQRAVAFRNVTDSGESAAGWSPVLALRSSDRWGEDMMSLTHAVTDSEGSRLKLLRCHFEGQWRSARAGVAGQGRNQHSSFQDSTSESR